MTAHESTTRTTIRRAVSMAAVLALAAVAGCGDDDGSVGAPSTEVTETFGETATSDDTTTSTEMPGATTAEATTPTTEPATTTTAPSTDATTTSDAPTTSTTAAPAPAPPGSEVLASWPEPPAAPSLDDLPYLLPTTAVPGVVSGIRFEEASPPIDSAERQYVEVWRAEGAPRLDVITVIGERPAALPSLNPQPVEVDGWDEARILEFDRGVTALQLIADDGYVSIDSDGVGADDLLAIGRGLRPHDEIGWTIVDPPLGLQRLYGAWAWSTTGRAFREIDWHGADGRLEAELAIGSDAQRFGIADIPESENQLVDVNGATALVVDWPSDDGPVFVTWSPEPAVVVSFSGRLSVDDAIAVARSIGEVDESTWNSVSVVDPQRDGCQSFVC